MPRSKKFLKSPKILPKPIVVVLISGSMLLMLQNVQELSSILNSTANEEARGQIIPQQHQHDVLVKHDSTVTQETISDQSKRLCDENPYAKYLDIPLSEVGDIMDAWEGNKTAIERALLERYHTQQGRAYHKVWDGFTPTTGCKELDCVGGRCGDDKSKIVCGKATDLQAPCVVYSIGGNDHWEFELDLLERTPCEVHTFDCTGDRERFHVPEKDNLHFHHICLGTENKVTDTGEFWTLEKATKTLNHRKIDLFKMDIEGYEFPIFQSEMWPLRTEKKYDTTVLPMQVLVEFHSMTQMPELSHHTFRQWKFPTDIHYMQERLMKMGYIVANRDDNARCGHCSELTLVRARCPKITQN